MASTRQTDEQVIDLTDEPDHRPQQIRSQSGNRTRAQRLPRFGRNVIDEVVDLEQEPEVGNEGRGEASSAPDVQFMGHGHRGGTSDIEFVRSTVRPTAPPRHPGPYVRRSDILNLFPFQGPVIPLNMRNPVRVEWARRARNLPHHRPHDLETLWIDGAGGVDVAFEIPDFATPVFDTPPPRQPEYKPPSPAPERFTRNVGEHDVVVCPNCGDELGTGDEYKQQIWVVKQCGHVGVVYHTESRVI